MAGISFHLTGESVGSATKLAEAKTGTIVLPGPTH